MWGSRKPGTGGGVGNPRGLTMNVVPGLREGLVRPDPGSTPGRPAAVQALAPCICGVGRASGSRSVDMRHTSRMLCVSLSSTRDQPGARSPASPAPLHNPLNAVHHVVPVHIS
eukprot:scaffold21992_cov100-Phaeocystis_antarctica.AAC.3